MPSLECSPNAQSSSSVSWEQNGYYADTIIFACIRGEWGEFKRVLSVAHASQPVERVENLEYRNQLSGMCCGAIYCSIESIVFNHPI